MRDNELFEMYRNKVEQAINSRVLTWSEIETISRRLNFRFSAVDLSRNLKESKINPSSLGINPVNTFQSPTYFYTIDKIWAYLTRNGKEALAKKGVFDGETLIELDYHKPIIRRKF